MVRTKPQASGAVEEIKRLFHQVLPLMPLDYIRETALNAEKILIHADYSCTLPGQQLFTARWTGMLHHSQGIHPNPSQIVGGATCSIYPGKYYQYMYLSMIGVYPQAQVNGYGTALMNCVKYWARTRDCKFIVTHADNYAIGKRT